MVLDEEDRQLEVLAHAPDRIGELGDLLVAQPACWLVEQEELGLRRERPRRLDPLQRAVREVARGPVRDAGQAEVLEDLGCAAAAAARVRAHQHVVEDRHRAEQLEVLERPRDPANDDAVRRGLEECLSLELDFAAVRVVQPGDKVEDGRLPGAVRADQADDLAPLDIEGDAVDRDDAAEATRDVPKLQQRHRATLRR